MRTRQSRMLALLLAALATALAFGIASAAPAGQDKGKSNHDEVVAYWTADRIKNAKPRELFVDPPSGKIIPQRPGNGKPGGGGGGDPTAVTGAPWTKGGAVKSTTGKVLFTLPSGDYVCSGSIVTDGSTTDGRSLVLTAGHCVYDDGADVFATNWTFMPDFEGGNGNVRDCAGTPYGCWVATALVTTQAWANGDFNEDYGFAVMGPGGKDVATSLEGTLGTQNIVFNYSHPTRVYAFGYPHASPYDGTDLTYCAGTDEPDSFGSTAWGLKCDMTGGSSGGPWFVDFDESTGVGNLNSVNSFKYRGGKQKNHMFGPYFDNDTAATYTAAKAAKANTLVSIP